jgi:hypothetical protein
MFTTLRRFPAACLMAIALWSVAAAAQNATGEISGYVRDGTGAVVPGVTVTLTYPELAYTRTATTNGDGYFVFPGVPNGTADLAAELQGFQPSTRKGMTVELNARMRVDLVLQVGGITEQVDVSGGAVPPISTRADVAHLISGEQTREIPIDGRSYMQLMNIIPGVSRNEGSYEFGTSFRADGQQVNGLRKNFSGLTLDGSENLDAGSNATQVNNVSIDAIDQFKVLTSQYAAEYGKAGGAQINVVTKSGKRTFSGSAFSFLRDDRFDAKDFQTGEKARLDFKNFGWTLGGPVSWKGFNEDRSKLFFFVAQEWKDLQSQVGLAKTATTPSLLERQGNFSQSPRVPVDPLTGQPFPGGIIPAERLSPAGLTLANRFPLPDAGSRNIATIAPTQNRDIHEDIVRVDMRPDPASTLTGRYIRDRVEQLEPYGSFGGTSNYAQVPTAHDRFSDSVMLSYNHAMGTRLFHDLSVSLVRNDQDLNQTGDLYMRSGINIPELFPLNRNDRAPNITGMTGYTLGTGLLGNQYPTHIIGNYYTIKDNLTYARGSHSFKAGVYLGHFRKNEELRTTDAGSFTFTDAQGSATGVALANLLIGRYDTYTEADAAPYPALRYHQVELYVQDHWQARANLTLDYGLRYQYMPAMFERDNRIATFDPALYDPALAPQQAANGNIVPGTGLLLNGLPVAGIAIAGENGVPRGLYDADRDNIAPRVGFTWDPTNSGDFALRGGLGVFYDRPVVNSSRDQAASPPFVRTMVLSNGSVDDPAGGAASTAPQGGFEAISRGFKSPAVYQWSLGFQRTLPWNLVADVNYVGNEARNLLRVRELNFVEPDPTTGRAPTPINLNRPYKGYGRIVLNETTAESDYQALQVALNRRADATLSFGVAYTLSRSRGDADSEDSTSSGSLPQDPRDPAGEYGYQDFDRRHVLAVNYIWHVPSPTADGALRHLLGGWQLSGITRYNTGRRLNITAGSTSNIFGDSVTIRANGVEGVDPNSEPAGGRTESQWLNPAAFSRPSTNTLGNLPRNSVVGPSFLSSDLSLMKNVRVNGRLRLQLRAEAFNVFNQKNYRSIATNITATNFGAVTDIEPQRIMQLGVKVLF